MGQGLAGTREAATLLRAEYETWLAGSTFVPTAEERIDPQLFLAWMEARPRAIVPPAVPTTVAAGLTRVTGYQPEVLFSELHDDLINALLSVHPTALREAYLEHPEVKWDHIGGQHEVKQSLKEALAWPIMVFSYIHSSLLMLLTTYSTRNT